MSESVVDLPSQEPAPAIELPAAVPPAYEELVTQAAAGTAADADLSLVFDLPVELAVEIGRTTMTIRETLAIAPGSLIQLNRLAGEPVDLLVNGHLIARGEVVAIDEEFGLRVTEILTPE
jgi:flagellar motor switch protein FliN